MPPPYLKKLAALVVREIAAGDTESAARLLAIYAQAWVSLALKERR